VEIVVGTPGRLEDLISTGKLDLSAIRFFVLDECDGLLSAGYGELISRIYKKIPQVTSSPTPLPPAAYVTSNNQSPHGLCHGKKDHKLIKTDRQTDKQTDR